MALALYRKYRPATLAEVVGQEHVTVPLRRALETGRLNHAYLFSGPRGCGKTSSARILARSLNCEQGPTPDPCGVCDSCRELAANGPGSIDVIELDAASHGSVEDARELVEKAHYPPIRDRNKIYIIDEAHMVSSAAFNALLKLVEEPPDFVTFLFATTVPEKVLATIRSRTHHYPFKLLSRADLTGLFERILADEQVEVEPGVLPLVVRAAEGSARDGLSILDQVVASAGTGTVTREHAAGLLGVTPDVLLDEVMDAFAAADAASVFRTVETVLESGLDPQRFTRDVLERLRDLVILEAVPDAAERGVLDCPPEQIDVMRRQAAALGRAGTSRAADLFAASLDERGSAPPRLLLELLCARVLLPAASDDDAATLSRLERLERRFAIADPSAGPAAGAPVAPPHSAPEPAHRVASPSTPPAGARSAPAPAGRTEPAARPPAAPTSPARTTPENRPDSERATGRHPDGTSQAQHRPASPPPPVAPPVGSPVPAEPQAGDPVPAEPQAGSPVRVGTPDGSTGPDRSGSATWPESAVPGGRPRPTGGPAQTLSGRSVGQPAGQQAGVPAGGLDVASVRRVWDTVLEQVKTRKRVAHAFLREVTVVSVENGSLTLSFTTPTLASKFGEGANVAYLQESLVAVLGVSLDVVCTSAGGPRAAGSRAAAPSRTSPPERDGFAPGDEAADEDPDEDPDGSGNGLSSSPGGGSSRVPEERGEDAALRLVQSQLGGRVLDQG